MKTNIWTKCMEWNMTWTCSWDLHYEPELHWTDPNQSRIVNISGRIHKQTPEPVWMNRGGLDFLSLSSEWTAEDWTFSLSLLNEPRRTGLSLSLFWMNRGGLDFLSLSSVCDPCGCFISSLFDSLCSEPMQRHASRVYFLFIYICVCVCVCVWLCMHVFLCPFIACFNADLRRSTLDLNHLTLEELETGG